MAPLSNISMRFGGGRGLNRWVASSLAPKQSPNFKFHWVQLIGGVDLANTDGPSTSNIFQHVDFWKFPNSTAKSFNQLGDHLVVGYVSQNLVHTWSRILTLGMGIV